MIYTPGNLRLRAVEPLDADFMYEAESDPDASKWTDTQAPLSRKIIREYALSYDADPFSAGQIRFIAECPGIGPVGIADIYDISQRDRRGMAGIYILPSQRRKGYALQALNLLCRYAGETLLLNQLNAFVAESNIPSKELFRKAGFRHVATLPLWRARSGPTLFENVLAYSFFFANFAVDLPSENPT